MAEFRAVSPLLDHMTVGQRISSREGVSVYEIRDQITGQEFILKHIAIPASDDKVQGLILSGAYADVAEANAYYKRVTDSMVAEFEITRSMQDSPYILKFLDQQVEPKASGIGYDVYAITEKAQSLKKYAMENAFSRLAAVNLGIDLCDALTAMREKGYVHQNLKPENVFLSDKNLFMVGDIGYASMQDMRYGSLPEQYFSSCTAPELHEIMSGLNPTIDIYSVGSILYQIYNGYHAPFVDEKTPAKVAEQMRFSGKEFPAPLYADYEMAEIILKACAFKPEDRYQTPGELKQALEVYMQRNAITDTLIVPPIISDPEPLLESDFYEETGPVRFADVDTLDEDFKSHFAPEPPTPPAEGLHLVETVSEEASDSPEQEDPEAADTADEDAEEAEAPPKKKKKKLGGWIALAAALLLLAGMSYVYFFTTFGKGLYHYFLKVDGLRVTDVSATSISARLQTEVDEALLLVSCQDVYGNSMSAAPENGQVLFEGLKPGTPYTLTVSAVGTHKVTGNRTANASTLPAAEILSFTASSGNVEGAVSLNLVTKDDSTEPEAWTLEYDCAGEETRTQTFSGHSLQLPGLTVGKEYTFRLVSTEDVLLLGQTEVRFTPLREILAENLSIERLVDQTLTVVWDCTTEPPERWTVTCTGEDGASMTLETQECTAVFQGVELGKEYLVELEAPALFKHTELLIPADLISIDSFEAVMESNGLILRWSTAAENDRWLLVRSVEGTEAMTEAQEVSGNEAVLADLLPGVHYLFTLKDSNGKLLVGQSTVDFTSGDGEKMNERGVNPNQSRLTLYLTPAETEWGLADLGEAATELRPGDKVSFALTCAAKRGPGDVEVLYVIRNAEGVAVSYGRSSYVWNDLWVRNTAAGWNQYSFLGSLNSLPAEDGTYTVELYFSLTAEGLPAYQLAGVSAPFTVSTEE